MASKQNSSCNGVVVSHPYTYGSGITLRGYRITPLCSFWAGGMRWYRACLVLPLPPRSAVTKKQFASMGIFRLPQDLLEKPSSFPQCLSPKRQFLVYGYPSPVTLSTINDTAESIVDTEPRPDTAFGEVLMPYCIISRSEIV